MRWIKDPKVCLGMLSSVLQLSESPMSFQNNTVQLLGNPNSEQIRTSKIFHSFTIWFI